MKALLSVIGRERCYFHGTFPWADDNAGRPGHRSVGLGVDVINPRVESPRQGTLSLAIMGRSKGPSSRGEDYWISKDRVHLLDLGITRLTNEGVRVCEPE